MTSPKEAPIYLDHHATTPCDPRVVEKMLPFFTEHFGNPASITHAHGRKASMALADARLAIARFLGVLPAEIYFTAGATESAEMRELKKRNRLLEQENEILRRAAAYLARDINPK